METLFTVYNPYEGQEFTGTDEECQQFIADYGAGWSVLETRPATKDEIENLTP